MKFQKNGKDEGKLCLVEYSRCEDKRYALLCVEFRRAHRHAVYIEDSKRWAIEWIAEEREEAKEIFGRLVRGRLSVIHLPDVAEDLSKKYEFFQ